MKILNWIDLSIQKNNGKKMVQTNFETEIVCVYYVCVFGISKFDRLSFQKLVNMKWHLFYNQNRPSRLEYDNSTKNEARTENLTIWIFSISHFEKLSL